ncbi:MAG: hypothetical protein Q9161_001643 [Pseudevernia consocians]
MYRKNLNTQQSTSPINLEMVRPGTYEALQEKLESTTREKGRGYFHIVHFDLHGRVRNHTAHLRFTDKDRGYDDKPASVVAELLVANGVHSVVMNACESATASKGMDANMVETLDDRQRQPNPLRLNNFILSFEHSTFSEEMTFLHGPPIAGKSLFLDQLSRLWLSTKSVDRVYVIQARIFLKGQSLPHLIQGHSKFLYATAGGLLRTQNEELKPCQRVVIIIDHVDELFSNDLTSQQRARAKAHLDTFILNVVGKESDTFRPSLIVVGRQGSDWLHKHFNNFDFDPMHFHFDSRPALHHPR